MNSRPPLHDAASAPEQALAGHGKRAGGLLPGMSPAQAFSTLAAPLVAQVTQRAGTLAASADPEHLHKLRVALRRLRSLWWAYDPLIDRRQAKLQQLEFKALADSVGQTRDWDILKHLLAEDTLMPGAFTELVERIELLRADALLRSRATIAVANIDAMLQQQIASVLQQLDAASFDEPLAGFAANRIAAAQKALQKRLKRVLASPDPGYDALHEVRIAGKKLRYLQEFFAPLIDSGSEVGVVQLTRLQDELGTLNDIVASEALLLAHAGRLGEHAAAQAAMTSLKCSRDHSRQRVDTLLRAMNGMLVDEYPGSGTN
ncbi:MAG TPA: CHAD domain-containing protein [Paraburkholderia sp.]